MKSSFPPYTSLLKKTIDLMSEFALLVVDLRKSKEYKKLQAKGYYPEPYPLFMDEDKVKKRPWILLDIIEHGIILFDSGNVLRKVLARLEERLRKLGSRKIVLPDGTWYWVIKPDWKPGEVMEL
jgi:hypothetical protein